MADVSLTRNDYLSHKAQSQLGVVTRVTFVYIRGVNYA